MPTVMISCGEASGDLYAGALAAEIRRQDPSAALCGLGGDRLRAAGAELIGEYGGLAVTGLAEALAVLPRSLATYRRLVAAMRARRPAVLVLIDFPDFNFRLGAAARRLGIPVVYYVSPQVWAWRRGRVRAMRRFVDRVLVIFPFEEDFYRRAGVAVELVGHPLIDLARPAGTPEAFRREVGLPAPAPVVALLPGSRPNEVRAILPGLCGAARLIRSRLPAAGILVARAPRLDENLFAPLRELDGAAPPVTIEGRTDDVLAAADVALVASGTATIQAALHERPMVVVYRLSRLTYWLGRPFVHTDTYGMVNLVAGRRVVPELIQDDFTPESVAGAALAFLTDQPHAARTRAALREVRLALGAPGASGRAAAAILRVAHRVRG